MNKWCLYYKPKGRKSWALHELTASDPMRTKVTARTWLNISENAVFAENTKGKRFYPNLYNKMISNVVMLFD